MQDLWNNMNFSPYTVFFVTFYIFQLAEVGSTGQCRTIPSVHDSTTSIEANTYYGGHIWQHIGDLYKIPSGAFSGDTQSGKTLFVSENDFRKAWNNWRNKRSPSSIPKDCDGYASVYADCVNAASIEIYKAIECDSVQNRICVYSTTFFPNSVIFVYKKGIHGWFLRTAYPSAKYC